jgi:hypothetical protein
LMITLLFTLTLVQIRFAQPPSSQPLVFGE